MGKVDANYVSEHTKFMAEWMQAHPEEQLEQQKGRALWWDKPQKLETVGEHRGSAVPTKPYYYQTDES